MTENREGLIFKGALPLVLKKLQARPDDYEQSRANRSNEILLKSGLLFNDHQDLDEYHELSPFLIKQDLKLNLLLDLMSDLVKSSSDFPAACSVQMTPDSLVLEKNKNDEGLQKGDIVGLEIYLVAEMPKPLSLYGILEKTDPKWRIDFFAMEQQVSDQLEKIIFRFHRRRIAQQKSAVKASVIA